jgi:type II secretory ATPase GspE/PulE/Tfp pilus assembly ATPase PilB-like protein
VNENLQRLVIRKETASALKQHATFDGMETLRKDGWRRVLLDQTRVEEVVCVAQKDEAVAETN